MNIFDLVDEKILKTVWETLWTKIDNDTATDAEHNLFWELGRYYDHKKKGA